MIMGTTEWRLRRRQNLVSRKQAPVATSGINDEHGELGLLISRSSRQAKIHDLVMLVLGALLGLAVNLITPLILRMFE